MGQIEDAAKAYRAAVAGLTSAQETARVRIATARERVEETRAKLAAVIVDEARAGASQVDLIRRSGYSRETVRTILRRGGVEPD